MVNEYVMSQEYDAQALAIIEESETTEEAQQRIRGELPKRVLFGHMVWRELSRLAGDE